ncbi:MAG: hypothetical protein ABJL49_05540 [Parasphingorhabdus sp.]
MFGVSDGLSLYPVALVFQVVHVLGIGLDAAKAGEDAADHAAPVAAR